MKDLKEKMKKEQEEYEKRELIERKQKYYKFIKIVHRPQIDVAKVKELQNRRMNLKHPVKEKIHYTPGMTKEQVEKLNNKEKPPENNFFKKRRSIS